MESESSVDHNKVDEKTICSEFRDYIRLKKKMSNNQLDDVTLLKFLRSRSYDFKESYKVMSNYVKLVVSRPDLFCWRPELIDIARAGLASHYPVKNCDGSRIIITQSNLFKTTGYNYMDWLSLQLFMTEISLIDEDIQRSGCVFINDMTGFDFRLLSQIGLTSAKLMAHYFTNCSPLALNCCHFINENRLTGLLMKLFNPFLSEEITKRIHFHSDKLDKLYKFIPKACLPPLFGGTNQEFDGDYYVNLLVKHKETVVNHWESLRKLELESK